MTQVEFDEKRDAIIDAMLDYYKENDGDFARDLEELDSYNGYLGDDRYFYMSDLNDLLYGLSPLEILERAGKNFNACDDFVQFTIYGLESSDYRDYSHLLARYTIEDILDNRSHLYLCDGIQEFIDQLEELEQEEIDEIC